MNGRHSLRVAAVVAVVAAAIAGSGSTDAVAGQDPAPAGPGSGWQASWRTAPQPPIATGPSHDGFTGQTVRMVIHPTAGGQAVRVRLSNLYGTAPLQVAKVAVATQDTGPTAVAKTQRVVTFDGSDSATIPAGGETVSDAVPFATRAGKNLLVSLYLTGPTGPTTWHNKAQATSYISSPGDWTTEPGGSPYQSITPSWFFLDGLDVLTHPLARTIVAFGDSITDGAYSTIDADRTYPDWLARRLGDYAVLNEGIGGNQILTDTQGGGPSALHRIQRDAFEQPGVTDVIFLEGVNDIGANATAQQLIDGMTQIVDQAHARCLRIIGGTITPFKNSVYYTDEHEKTREAVNAWIRTSGQFDGVADFDKALRDGTDPLVIDPRYHTVGDLHPNDAGYKAMAAAVNVPKPATGPGCTHD
ncbi:SGNH/GDSL hydrolase family protein [Rugosimonospora africana]|uniref:SGNH hydrolase n=1 Tax=Rugosimonospora africana TaxID=556532 RepID=A0A8J3QP79_9ACTN|nr:SGNH/GDSL hydrolase family protein [Rugosimonospora africana]GIH14880.1 SGNH hydrolase [Rugosimonospora africana]